MTRRFSSFAPLPKLQKILICNRSAVMLARIPSYFSSTSAVIPLQFSTNCQQTSCKDRQSLFISSSISLHRIRHFSDLSVREDRYFLQENKRKARQLLDEKTYPLGSLTPSHVIEAKNVLDFFKQQRTTDEYAVNLSIAMIERLVAERAVSKELIYSKWFCEPRYYHALIWLWREASKQAKRVVSPQKLVQKLQTMARTLPEFRYDNVILNLIMDVVIKQAPVGQAPLIAEELLKFMQNEAIKTQRTELRPHIFIYCNVIHAWAVSGLPQAPDKMDSLLQAMRKEGIVPNEVTYNIVLRYWSKRGAVDKIDEILDTMKAEKVELTRTSLTQAIYGYAHVGNTEKAEELLSQLTELRPKDEKEDRMIAESVQSIMLAYRRIVDDSNIHFSLKDKAVLFSEALFEKFGNSSQMTNQEKTKLIGTMLDIYTRAGKHDKVETMSQNLRLNPVQLTILIKSLGKADKADQATTILKRVLSDSHAIPTLEIYTFNVLVNAWAESSQQDAADQAYDIVRLLREDPQCKQLGLRPNTFTFNTLLKCHSKSIKNDAGKKAIEIVDEMERNYNAGDRNVKPDVITYTLAIKACMQAGNADEAEALMGRMEKSDTPPDLRTYNEILKHWSKTGTPEAAERIEQILACMKQLAMTKCPALKPDDFSYNIAMSAWSKSGHPESSGRMWNLYEQMKADNVEPNISTFNTLISFFANSPKQRKDLEQAEILLQYMENSKRSDIRPDNRQYAPVVKGWLSIGDVNNATRALKRTVDAYIIDNKNTEAAPNAVIIDMVTQGWIKAGDLRRATLLVAKIQKLRDENLLPEGPNSRTYHCLLGAWENSQHPEKAINIINLKNRLDFLMCSKVV